MTDPDRRPQARSDVVFRPLADDEWALFDPVAGRVHALNLAAALVWEHCDGRRTAADIATAVREAYGAAPDTVADDVRSALERFAHEGLLTWT